MLRIKEYAVVHKGIIRDNNEDNLYIDGFILPQNNDGLKNYSKEKTLNSPFYYASFDGIGGLENGDEAAYLCSKYLLQALRKRIDNNKILSLINKKIILYKKKFNINLGSTANFVFINKKEITTFQVGDSSIFLLHNNEFYKLGYDSDDIIDNYIGNKKIKIKKNNFSVLPNTKIIICSDGLTKLVDKLEIEYMLKYNDDGDYITNKLLNMALQNGGTDNITIITLIIEKKNREKLYWLLFGISIILFLVLVNFII